MNIKLVLEYDGTSYHGFQIQLGAVTVQEKIEKAIDKFVTSEFKFYSAGRTDAGVHAIEQVCNFKCDDLRVSPEYLCIAMNRYLPNDIRIKESSLVSDDFHSRFSAKERVYKYVIYNSLIGSAIYRNYSWHVKYDLDVDSMIKGAKYIEGYHDFKAFTSATYKDSTMRIVNYTDLKKEGKFIIFRISANAYTRSMVRNIVGTLVEVGRGKRKFEEIQKILISQERQEAGLCAPPQGLFLERIKY